MVVRSVQIRVCFFIILGLVTGLINQAAYAEKNHQKKIMVQFRSSLAKETMEQEAYRLNSQATTYTDLKQALLDKTQCRLLHRHEQLNVDVLSYDQEQEPADMAAQLASSALVKWAEPDYRYQLFTSLPDGPNDPFYQSEIAIAASAYHGAGQVRCWWMDQIKADQVFADHLVNERDVIVAILDSGVRLTHEDLAGKIMAGYDFENGDQDPTDDNGHGTHVAGLAAAVTNNNLGISGVGYLDQIRILPVKVADEEGSAYISAVIQGIQWAVDQGAKVINMSFGSPQYSLALEEAVQYAHREGCVVVAAAGNYAEMEWMDFGINPVMYPASYNHVISVAATNSINARASYSEFNNYVDIAAPGGDFVYSYALSHYDPAGMIISTYDDSDSSYQAFVGTSMASPIVAGAAAIVLAHYPELTPDEVEALLTGTADKIDGLDSDPDTYNSFLGWGQINLYQALTKASTYPASFDEKASYNYPNPFNPAESGMTNIMLPISGDQAHLIIVDSFGHKVKTMDLTSGQVIAGLTISWDGKDDHQATVANGVYPYILKIDNHSYRNKIVVKQ